MQDNYDVIIIGASIAGLECAKNLAGSDLSVLVLEKNKQISRKVCAEGIVSHDLEYIPKNFINFDFQKMVIHYKNKSVVFPKEGSIISTTNRENFLNNKIENLKKFNNIEISTNAFVSEIVSNSLLKLSNGKNLNFKFLVGADGSTSIVRKYLNLPLKKFGIAIQYIIPKAFKKFEIYLESKLFGTGYLWIFPNKDYTAIGCGSDLKIMSPKILRKNFDSWLKENNFDISSAKFEVALISYDYKGYRFDNIFLAGDAAGLASGITGEGMYPAFLSGKQIAMDIIRTNKSPNLIKEWLKKKRQQEKYMFFLKNSFLKKILFFITVRLLPIKKFQEMAIKIIK